MSEISPKKHGMEVSPLPSGGFVVRDARGFGDDGYFRGLIFAASTLKETLDFMRKEFLTEEKK